jgi:hypothetical protein
MLVQVLLPREALSGVALAVLMGAVQLLAWTAVLIVDFTLVAQQSAAVCETWELLAAFGQTLVRPVMLVHMFPADMSVECKI